MSEEDIKNREEEVTEVTEEEVQEATQEQPEEEQPEEQPEEPEEQSEEPEEEPEEEEKPPSRREQLRIQELLEKMSGKKETKEQPKPKSAFNYEDELDADEDVIKQLKEDRDAYGRDLYEQGLSQARSIQFHTRLEIDAPRVEQKHAFLNKEDSENFHPALAQGINSWYLSTVGYDSETQSVQNADVRYADFVDGIVELAEEIANTKVEKATTNIKRQASQTGLRPDGSKAKSFDLSKAPGDMSDDELQEALKLSLTSLKK